MKITGWSFALLLLLCLAGCDIGGGSNCPAGQQCCQIQDQDHPYANPTYSCMATCPDGYPEDDSFCQPPGGASLRKAERSLVGQHVSLRGNTDRAVLLFTSPSCRFASANESFHQALYKAALHARIPFYVVVARYSDAITFKNRGEFAEAPVVLSSELSFHLNGTPTIMLVQSGQIHVTWTGERKTVEQQQDVLSRISNVGIINPQ